MIDLGMLSEPEARSLWADVLGLPLCTEAQPVLDQQRYFHFGPIFWWLHRALPIAPDIVLTATPPHPETQRLVNDTWLAEVPGKMELLARRFGIEMDPDKVMLDSLLALGWLKPEQAPRLTALRGVVKDPLSHWLVLQGVVTETQINSIFREISTLPLAKGWAAPDVERLAAVLPPGFAEANGVFCLSEADNQLIVGLSRMPSPAILRDIYDRLDGRPVFFHALTFEDAQAIQAFIK